MTEDAPDIQYNAKIKPFFLYRCEHLRHPKIDAEMWIGRYVRGESPTTQPVSFYGRVEMCKECWNELTDEEKGSLDEVIIGRLPMNRITPKKPTQQGFAEGSAKVYNRRT